MSDLVTALLVLGFQYLYEVEIALRWNGQTQGKRVMKIAIIAMAPNTPLSRGKLAYRADDGLRAAILHYGQTATRRPPDIL